MNCEICNRECKNYSSLSQHLKKHNISPNEYYDKYLKKENEGICGCGKYTKFQRLSTGYRKFCSYYCARNSKETKEKFKNTCLEKYDSISPIQNENIKNKRIQNNIKKFGVDYIQQTYEFKRKVEETNLKKYGNKCSLMNDEVQEKRKNTMIRKHGVENPFENHDILNKRKLTYVKKYDVDNPMKNCEIKDKQRKTVFNKYNVEYSFHNEKAREKNKNNFLLKLNKQLQYLNLKINGIYNNSFDECEWECLICHSKFNQTWQHIQKGFKCLTCYPRNQGYSKYEKEILEFVNSLNLKTIDNDRFLIKPLELDIYIPSKNLAIEFNGLYYHSEKFKINKNYHLNKTEICNKNNIRIIHIFEDEWIFKQEIVKSRLKQILSVNNSKRIHARKCIIKEISPKIKNKFLDLFHIQGCDRSNIKIGAFYNDELVSVMTFSHGNISKGSKNIDGIWELSRFCSNYDYHIPGIASKLFTYFKRNYEWKEIFSYADRRWSQGNVYFKLGFKLDSITKPNYWYVKGLNRIHRFNLRKKSNDPQDIPEWILRSKEGYHRIWDCGHLKFVFKRL